jgi:hypothetical protein
MRYQVLMGMLAAAGAIVGGPDRVAAQEPGYPGEELRIERDPDRLMRIVLNRRARLGSR